MTERAKYWSGLMAAWARSGLSQAEFCRRRGIHGGTFACLRDILTRLPHHLVVHIRELLPRRRQARVDPGMTSPATPAVG